MEVTLWVSGDLHVQEDLSRSFLDVEWADEAEHLLLRALVVPLF